jgi:hypothetical protein
MEYTYLDATAPNPNPNPTSILTPSIIDKNNMPHETNVHSSYSTRHRSQRGQTQCASPKQTTLLSTKKKKRRWRHKQFARQKTKPSHTSERQR